MTPTAKDHAAAAMLADLRQLVVAIDRRVPHIERAGEAKIAREAADLRRRAIDLIHDLEATLSAR
jgi:hypothetical protein